MRGSTGYGRAGLAWLALAALGPAPAVAADRKLDDRLTRLGAAAEAQDCKTVLELGPPLLGGKRKAGLNPQVEASIYDVVVGCEEQDAKTRAAAYAHALAGTKLEHSSDYLWHYRLLGELRAERWDAAVATVEALAQGRGAALNTVPIEWMWAIENKMETAGRKDLRRRLLAVLASDAYGPDGFYGPPDPFRLRYARLLTEAGEKDKVRILVERLDTPDALSTAMFDPLVSAWVPVSADPRAAAERQLSRYRAGIGRHPDRIEPVREAARTLRQLGRPAEALELLGSIAERIKDPSAFEDSGEQLNWYWDDLARTQARLGRYEEAAAAFRKGVALGEAGTLNVSQTINLAQLHNRFGRGEEALKTLAVFEAPGSGMSPYGHMEMRFARGCAQALAGRPAAAAADLEYMRAHEKDHPEALADVLLCLGDMDGAAAAFIRRLEDPERRAAALVQLSDYDEPPVVLPPDPVDSRLAPLKARDDVKAAIARAGGVRRFRLQRGEL